MASTDAMPVPRKNAAYRVTFPLFKSDGTLITGAAGLDSEVSKDGGAFSDCTAEATEIGSSGFYYLDLSATEMNADTVAVVVKTSSTGAVYPTFVFYPEEAGDVRVNVTAWDGNVLSSLVGALPLFGVIESGTAQAATANTLQMRSAAGHGDNTLVGATVLAYGSTQGYWQAATAASNVGSTDTITMESNWAVTPTGTISYLVFPTAPGASPAVIAAAVLDIAMSGHSTSGTVGERLSRIPNVAPGANGGLPTVDASNRVAGVSGNVAGSVGSVASGGITSSSFAADAITATALATSAASEIQGGLATTTALAAVATDIATILAAVDTEVAAIKAKTDQLTFSVSNLLDVNMKRVIDLALQQNGTGTQNIGGP